MRVAIAGATGLVGEMMMRVLEERDLPVGDLVLLASHRSRGTKVYFRGESFKLRELKPSSFRGIDICLFATESHVSREYVKEAVRAGAVAIDNSSAFRMDKEVPLVVPEVNSEELRSHRGIIANPNCSTIQLVVVLWPIHDRFSLRRVVVSTYQSVSGKGRHALRELADQMDDYRAGNGSSPYRFKPEARAEVFRFPIIGNLIPHIDSFAEHGYTGEEQKIVEETRKIMGLPELRVTATCVRVPVLYCHSESVNVETDRDVDIEEVRALLSRSQGIRVVDDIGSESYPVPAEAADSDLVFVGRIRRDSSVPHGLNLWVVADNLRKGAATNAIQIAEKLLDLNLL